MKNGNSSDDDNAYKEQSISNAYNDKMMLNVWNIDPKLLKQNIAAWRLTLTSSHGPYGIDTTIVPTSKGTPLKWLEF